MMEKETFANPKAAQLLAKKAVAFKYGAGERDPKVYQKYKPKGYPTIVIADADGSELLRVHYVSTGDLVAAVDGASTFKATIDLLDKAKDATAKLPLLKKIATLPGTKSREILKAYAEDEANSEGLRKAAIEGLAKQPSGLKDAVGYLGNKSQAFRTAAFNGLKAAGPYALDDLMDGIKGDTAEQRENSYKLLIAGISKNPKLQKDAAFWKTGKEAERKNAADAWKQWWDSTKPPELRVTKADE